MRSKACAGSADLPRAGIPSHYRRLAISRYPASRLLQRLRAAVRPTEEGAADYAGVLLCPCAAGLLELADIERIAREGKQGKPVSPIALEAVRRLDVLFEIERAINGRGADERHAVRQEKSKPLLEDMHAWLLRERETLSRSSEVLKPMNNMLRRSDDFARFLDDGRICLTNNCAERALRGDFRRQHAWRRPCRHCADDDHDLPPQRRRSQGLARRHPRRYRGQDRVLLDVHHQSRLREEVSESISPLEEQGTSQGELTIEQVKIAHTRDEWSHSLRAGCANSLKLVLAQGCPEIIDLLRCASHS